VLESDSTSEARTGHVGSVVLGTVGAGAVTVTTLGAGVAAVCHVLPPHPAASSSDAATVV